MTEQALREHIVASYKNRAMMYYHIFQELKKEVGEDKAVGIMKRGIYNRGLEVGKRYAKYAPADLEGLKSAFMTSSVDKDRLFAPVAVHCDSERLEIQMGRCPLKEAWQEAGLSDAEIVTLCDIAAVVDNGTFEGAGFKFEAETWQSGKEGCCRLKIYPGS